VLRLILAGIVVILVAMLVAGHVSRQPPPGRPAASAQGEAAPARPGPARGASGPTYPVVTSAEPTPSVVGGAAAINSAAGPTPTVELMARLAIRRRLTREGNRVYIDSLLAHTDSTIVRWPDSAKTVMVAFIADTAVPGWTPAARSDAEAGMRLWAGNEAGVVLQEVDDTNAAAVKVRWAVTVSDSGRVGVTSLSWGPDGSVHSADVTLALRSNTDSAVLDPATRRRVAAHEFGHVMGLPHSGLTSDLMYPTSPIATPSRRDRATLLLLYAVPPGPLRVITR
jgi:Matrixin